MKTCYFCKKGLLEEKRVTVDFRWGNRLIVIEDVPAKVCNECGERYYSAAVSRELERVATEGKAEKTVAVPLVRLGTCFSESGTDQLAR
jgi:YgiT-type zinc finger domain-containing protein